jgi:hypothetical protein
MIPDFKQFIFWKMCPVFFFFWGTCSETLDIGWGEIIWIEELGDGWGEIISTEELGDDWGEIISNEELGDSWGEIICIDELGDDWGEIICSDEPGEDGGIGICEKGSWINCSVISKNPSLVRNNSWKPLRRIRL